MERAIRVVQQLKGPVVPVNTCFGDDDSLDVGAMRKYVNWLCEQNIPVILLTYGSSEFCSLTSALHLHGLYPNHRLRTPAVSHTDERHQEVQAVLERIFGNTESAEP